MPLRSLALLGLLNGGDALSISGHKGLVASRAGVSSMSVAAEATGIRWNPSTKWGQAKPYEATYDGASLGFYSTTSEAVAAVEAAVPKSSSGVAWNPSSKWGQAKPYEATVSLGFFGSEAEAALAVTKQQQQIGEGAPLESTSNMAGKVVPTAQAAAPPRVLEGKVAIVTGSSSGIGLMTAEVLASQGATVVLHGSRDRSQMVELEANLAKEHNVPCKYIQADMSSPTDVTRLIEQTTEAFGRVDILVNNAGIQHVSSIVDFPEDAFDRVININVKAIFMATKAVLPGMMERGFGRIINIASAHGKVASLNKSAYVASKHAVVGFTKATALEAAGTGVTAVTVCPGWVLTPLVQKQIQARADASGKSFEEEQRALVSEKHPSGQAAAPEDLANTIAFLCSPTGNQITGTEISVDGGWCAI